MRITSEIQSLCDSDSRRYNLSCVAVDPIMGLACATNGRAIAFSAVADPEDANVDGTVMIPADLLSQKGEKRLQLNSQATRWFPKKGKQPEYSQNMEYGQPKFPRVYDIGTQATKHTYLRVLLDPDLLRQVAEAIKTIGSDESTLELSIPVDGTSLDPQLGDRDPNDYAELPIVVRFHGNANIGMIMPKCGDNADIAAAEQRLAECATLFHVPVKKED